MNATNNSDANWPMRHVMFVALRDGGNSPANLAEGLAAMQGISVEELKVQCRRTGEEWIARVGGLSEINQHVYIWAKG